MGAPKKYDREDLLKRAVELFRRNGFNGTSTADLVAELGINRKSMYAEFGSKQGLFEASLVYYSENNLARVLAPIEAPDAGTFAIQQAFLGYANASKGWFLGRGCLMCNTAVERAALDAASKAHVDSYLSRIESAFRNCLANAVRTEDISKSADLDRLARFLTTAMIGVAALIRAEARAEQVEAACDSIADLLAYHRPHTQSG